MTQKQWMCVIVVIFIICAWIDSAWAGAALYNAFWGNKYQTCINNANHDCTVEEGGYNKDKYDLCYVPKEAVCAEKYPADKVKLLGK